MTRLYKFDGVEWALIGEPIVSQNLDGSWANNVMISGNGEVVAITDPSADLFANNGGVVNIYDLSSLITSTIGQNVYSNSISVFPNPVLNLVSVTSDEPINSIMVYDTKGRIVSKKDAVPYVDMSFLPPGGYILRIITNRSVFTRKIIKK